MAREDIECIIKWFSHIEQLATDGKTANGFEMPIDRLLATIKVVAKDSREYVEKFCKTSEIPNDKVVEGEVILNGHGLLIDVTKWGDGYKLKVIIKEN